jgi:hypothetical protein
MVLQDVVGAVYAMSVKMVQEDVVFLGVLA